ncbi:octopamine receptor oamb, putative [Babesia ovata]|uniref:Octopamine receptor oamb, putative n=1 Tax=Babesia ovata TaxID=189622 RepID=A0A2H6KA53_9APIC|nr:octopamine receptor oamb, putative [Babesia ovata]GBE59868.1 octopamine receptor oamb, putative [Babesia ovata]
MSNLAQALQAIRREWNLEISPAQATEIAREAGVDTNATALKRVLLNTDICVIRSGADNAGGKGGVASSTELDALPRPLLCQVLKVVDVTQPKDGVARKDGTGNPLYKVTLTTGQINFHAVLLDAKMPIVSLAPGTKVLLTERKLVHTDGIAVLRPNHYEVLGGVVPELHQPWVIQREVNFQRFSDGARRIVSDAPKFEPLDTSTLKAAIDLNKLSLKPPPPKSAKGAPAKDTGAKVIKAAAPKQGKLIKSAYKLPPDKKALPHPKAASRRDSSEAPAAKDAAPRVTPPPAKARGKGVPPPKPNTAGVKPPPKMSGDRPPKTDNDRAPKTNSDRTPKMTGDRMPKANNDRIPKESSDRTPKASADRMPKTSSDRTPKASADRMPKTSSDRIPKTSSDRTPKMGGDRPPKTSGDRTPKKATSPAPSANPRRNSAAQGRPHPAPKNM